jgi:DNA-binding MarR family transcriptional regulator
MDDRLELIAELFLTVYPRFRHLLMTQLQKNVDDEISLSQSRTLGKLVDRPITLSELADKLNVTRQGASLQVQYLVEHGWVQRNPDPNDRRSALLEVTEAGRAYWLEARQAKVSYIAKIFAQLTPQELDAFQTVFAGFQRILDQTESVEEE